MLSAALLALLVVMGLFVYEHQRQKDEKNPVSRWEVMNGC